MINTVFAPVVVVVVVDWHVPVHLLAVARQGATLMREASSAVAESQVMPCSHSPIAGHVTRPTCCTSTGGHAVGREAVQIQRFIDGRVSDSSPLPTATAIVVIWQLVVVLHMDRVVQSSNNRCSATVTVSAS